MGNYRIRGYLFPYFTSAQIGDFLQWLATVAKNSNNQEVEQARNAIMLLRMHLSIDPSFVSHYVPYLKYDQYSKLISALEKYVQENI